MRYKLETILKNGFEVPKKIKQNTKAFYTVEGDDGSTSIVPKKWVVENKRYISNISFGGSSIYVIKYEYDRAIELVIERMVQKMEAYPEGLNIYSSHYMAVVNQSVEEVTKFRKALSDVDVWNFLRGYDIDTQKIYVDCLKEAIGKCKEEIVLIKYDTGETSVSELHANKELLKARINELPGCEVVKENLLKEIYECIFYDEDI